MNAFLSRLDRGLIKIIKLSCWDQHGYFNDYYLYSSHHALYF